MAHAPGWSGAPVRSSVVGTFEATSSGTAREPAIRNVVSSDGEYFPCSIAMAVWRVTPKAAASSA